MNEENDTALSQLPYEFIPQHSVYVIIGVLVIFFNSCVLLVMWKKKALQKPDNALLGSLAVSDLCTGLIGLPLLFACTFTTNRYCMFCYSSVVLFKFISISTVLHILGIIAERYLQVIYPFVHRRLIAQNNRVKGLIVALWLISLTTANAPWFWWQVDCSFDNEDKPVYDILCFVVFFILPLVLITFFLTNICLAACRYFRENRKRCADSSSAQTSTPQAEIRITVVLLGMFLLFLVCWFPFFFVNIADGFGVPYPEWLQNAMGILRCLTSTLNPIVYTFYKEDFYQAFKTEAQRLLCRCKKTRNEQARKKTTPDNTPLVAFDNTTHEEMVSTLKTDRESNV